MSATSSTGGSTVWDNGDDIADWPPMSIGLSASAGTVQANFLFADGYHSLYVPSTAVKIVVTPPSPSLLLDTSTLVFQYQQGVAGPTPAKLLKVDKNLGTLEVGKIADLIVVDGNPLQSVSILKDSKRIRMVIQGGRVLKDLLGTGLMVS